MQIVSALRHSGRDLESLRKQHLPAQDGIQTVQGSDEYSISPVYRCQQLLLAERTCIGLRLGSKSRSIWSSISFGKWLATTKIGFFTLVSPISELRNESAANTMHALPLNYLLRSSYLVRVGHAQQRSGRRGQHVPKAEIDHAEMRIFGIPWSYRPRGASQIGILNV